MLSRRVVARSCVLAGLASLALPLSGMLGCQSASNSAGNGASSFNMNMAKARESDFAQRHQFYYYPTTQVYRDCDENRWLWSNDAGATWHSAARLPANIDLGNEIPFAVFLSSNSPAREHAMIAASYPADGTLPATAAAQGSSNLPE